MTLDRLIAAAPGGSARRVMPDGFPKAPKPHLLFRARHRQGVIVKATAA
jgi:hypothetical protein